MTKKKVSKLFNNNIFWAVISLVAALAIWLYMTATQEEEIDVTLSGVQVVFAGEEDLQATRGLVITDVSTRTVDVTVRGTRLNIGSLAASDVQAVIDVSRFNSTSNSTQSYNLVYPDGVDASAVRVVRSSPSTISFQVTRMDDKIVPVDAAFTGSVAEGYMGGDTGYEPRSITVSGPQSVLETIDRVYVEVELMDLDATRTVEAPFTLRDADGNEIAKDGLEFDFDTVTVTIPISKVKDVPIYVNLIEGAGATRENTSIKLSESSITIAGDAATVDGINRIEVGPVDLTSFELTYEGTLDVVLPNGVENISGIEEVDVSLEVTGLAVRDFTVTNISDTGLPEGYSAELVTHSLTVRIRGPQDALANLNSSNIRAVADLSNTTASGTMDIPNVQIVIDGALNCGAVGTYRLTYNISR